ncbi:hypothetical protein BH11PSE2_BH11PSE2_05570 [soil metagenome]
MTERRAHEPRSFDPPADLNLKSTAVVRYWSRRLQVTPTELEEVVERVSYRRHPDSEADAA